MANKQSRKRRATSSDARKPEPPSPPAGPADKSLPPARPPKRNLPLLILTATLMIGWITFLLVVAISVSH